MIRKNKTIITAIFGMIALIIIIVNVNYLLKITFTGYLDVTSDHMYTLSNGTKNIIQKLDSPVTIRFYFSYSNKKVPAFIKAYSSRIEKLLKMYETLSSGKIIVETYNTIPETDIENSAIIDKIQPLFINNTPEKFYFGINVSSVDENRTISFLSTENEKTIEYDITHAVFDVSHPQKPEIGIISSLPVFGKESILSTGQNKQTPDWIFLQELKNSFQVINILQEPEKLNKNISVLLIINPQNLNEEILKEIDNYLINGGKLIIFTDPYCISQMLTAKPNPFSEIKPKPGYSTLTDFYKAWGISFSNPDEVVIAPENAYHDPNEPIERVHPAILSLNSSNMNQDEIMTSGFSKINLIFAGSFNYLKNSNITVIPIIQTSSNSENYDNFSAYTPVSEIMENYKSSKRKQNLVLKLTGHFNSIFNNTYKNPSTPNNKSTVLLIGDADMLFNSFCVGREEVNGKILLKPLNNNIDFILNAVDQLSGSEDIIGLRTRKTKERNFVKFDAIYNSSTEQYRDKLSSLQKKLNETENYLEKLQEEQPSGETLRLSSSQINEIQMQRKQENQLKKEISSIYQKTHNKVNKIKNSVILFNTLMIPIILILAGISIAIIRKRKISKKKYKQTHHNHQI